MKNEKLRISFSISTEGRNLKIEVKHNSSFSVSVSDIAMNNS